MLFPKIHIPYGIASEVQASTKILQGGCLQPRMDPGKRKTEVQASDGLSVSSEGIALSKGGRAASQFSPLYTRSMLVFWMH